ncbi:UNVERIFIED_ASMBLY: prohead protease [Shigella phage 2019SD1]|uniref:Prohead protease n=1 Tax=Shigella phage 2019SD1 TaxID=2848074 RepID=A0A6M5CDF2_9CAUD|nr:head maturation protease [Shigella phage 2019SD1]
MAFRRRLQKLLRRQRLTQKNMPSWLQMQQKLASSVTASVGLRRILMDAKAIKVTYVKEVTGADISEKADAYIETAFDLAKQSDKMAAQRKSVKGDSFESGKSEKPTPLIRLLVIMVLVDRPIVARIGLQEYRTPYGIRREFRPASEVFKADSLATFAGKPITIGHVTVTPDNADQVVVGSCAGAGVPNGIGVEVPLSIYSKRAIESAKRKTRRKFQLVTHRLILTSGWGNNKTGDYLFEEDLKEDWKPDSPDWVKFDAIQTNIRVNHIALVFRGRAGIAKLNLDSEQDFPYSDEVPNDKGDEEMTVKIKLDGAVEFDVPKAVADHIEALKADAKAATEKLMALRPSATPDAKAIKVTYVKEVTGADISEKADAYIETAFDLAKQSDKMAAQRKSVKGDSFESGKSEKPTPLIRLLVLWAIS